MKRSPWPGCRRRTPSTPGCGCNHDGRELIQALSAARNAFEKLHIHLQAMPGLRFLVALPSQSMGPMLLIGGKPTQSVLAQDARCTDERATAI